MSKLQELINKLCPNGVEFKPLGDISNLSRGKVYGKDYISEHRGEYPVFSSQTVNDGELGKIDTYDYDGFYLTWTTDGAYAGTIFYRQGKFSITNVCGLISLKVNFINLKFLYYWLSIEAPKHVYYGMGNPKLMSNQMTSIMIPVPPIEVQEEIVRILDSFSDYAAELQAELQARKQQYEYYRNLLLTFNPSAYGCGTDDEQKDGVTTWGGHNYKIEWKKMGEIGTFIRGKRFVRTDIMEQGVPCIHYGDMYTYYGLYTNNTPTFLKEEKAQKMRFAQKNDIVIVAAGENKDDLGNAVAWLGEKPAAVHDACFIFRSNLYPNYISHICRSHNYHKQIKMFANEAKICSVSGQDLQKVLIPVPEYELQIKIASILDRFETLVNDLTNGLPAEIAAVKDQYEYYRNKLLTFKKLSA